MTETFRAILISRDEAKRQSVDVVEMSPDDLMEGDVDVAVEATTVNYKDGLAITGRSPVVRRWPMIPGVDLAGTVVRSDHARWKPGDKVVLNGWGLGETHYGAYAGLARVKGDWLVALPERFTPREAMAIGTAGYTAMLSVLAIERAGLTPQDGPAVVSGASGGVGSVAVALLARRGWEVIAVTGRTSEADYLTGLGATQILDRAELAAPGKPLGKERWVAGIDAVGSHTLANVLASTRYGGLVAACGLAQGMDLPATVAPFILRGVSLIGIDSVMAPLDRREAAWRRLAEDLDAAVLSTIAADIGFDELIANAQAIVEGTIRGRVVAKLA
ncbi:MDR family oxidoreductase [Jiella sonneratiae]|uniref:Oxidoreductase n=1 Tax=Jiella sonneratiae TaxID=2816856 RepID=A0ABS3J1X3_9HYPH|nr:MDR family oxidoreductase [Jiella sonneratiae]MBO0903675.1 oxidoreductase [Jiella sonneratiae]